MAPIGLGKTMVECADDRLPLTGKTQTMVLHTSTDAAFGSGPSGRRPAVEAGVTQLHLSLDASMFIQGKKRQRKISATSNADKAAGNHPPEAHRQKFLTPKEAALLLRLAKRTPVPPIYLIRGASRTPTGPPALVMAPSSL